MDVLINHPKFGSMWLDNAKIKDDTVYGEVWDYTQSMYMPSDYLGEKIVMNFPVTCIRKTHEKLKEIGEE